MNSVHRLVLFVLTVAIISIPGLTAQAAGARADLVQVIRLMGYGAGIHNFKNYVLRGREVYYMAARDELERTLNVIDRLEQGTELSATDRVSLAQFRSTVQQYRDGLDKTREWLAKSWPINEIDRSIVVDDTAAIAALKALRAKWEWSQFEEMEFQLGYGKAIHNFKNYVLRGRESYHTDALENFLAVDALIVNQLNDASLDDACRAALERVSRVAGSYRDYLLLIRRMLDMRRSERQLDLAVKVNDGPATTALAVCRESPH